MNWKHTLGAGAGTGATLAASMALIMVKIGLEPPSFAAALVIFVGMILISASAVKNISQAIGCCVPSLKHLIPISFLTFFLPIFGVTFGAPNSDLTTLGSIILMGTAGGLFWATPFALWSHYMGGGNSVGEEE